MTSFGKVQRCGAQGILELSSRHVLERSCVHNPVPVFSSGFLLACVRRTDVQWSHIRLGGSEPRVIGSSCGLLPVRRGLSGRSSKCTMIMFIESTSRNVTGKSQMALHRRVTQTLSWLQHSIYMQEQEILKTLRRAYDIRCINLCGWLCFTTVTTGPR